MTPWAPPFGAVQHVWRLYGPPATTETSRLARAGAWRRRVPLWLLVWTGGMLAMSFFAGVNWERGRGWLLGVNVAAALMYAWLVYVWHRMDIQAAIVATRLRGITPAPHPVKPPPPPPPKRWPQGATAPAGLRGKGPRNPSHGGW